MNYNKQVREFKKIAGLIKESHPANDKWYQDFEDGLRNLVRNKYISKEEYKYYMDALDHVDPMDDYGHMASAHDAAKEFVDDLRSKGSVKEEWDSPYDGGADDLAAMGKGEFRGFNHRAIEAAADDKISHTEEDDNGDPIYWSEKNPYVNYYIGSNDQIIKYDGKTGERYPIGDLGDYDQNKPDEFPFDYDDFPSKDDYDADYEEPRDDFDMAEVKKFKKIAGIKEDDYSEDPSSDLDDESESGDTATMGNIDEDDMDARRDQDDKTQYGQGGVLNI